VHWLSFDEAPAHHLVDGGFNERRRDPLALSVPLAVVRNRFLMVADVGLDGPLEPNRFRLKEANQPGQLVS
jgi:hypothetical protein